MNAGDVFNSENRFFSAMNKVWDVMVLNFYFLLTVIVGIGPAATALYYAIVKNVRRSRSYATTEFFRAFKANFKQGFILGILQLVGAFAMYNSYQYAMAMREDSTFAQAYFAIWFLFAVLFVATSIYLYPVLSRFSMPTGKVFKMAFILSLRHLPTTIFIALILAVMVLAVYGFYPMILFSFATYALVKSLLMEKVLRKYTPVPEEGDTSDAWYLE